MNMTTFIITLAIAIFLNLVNPELNKLSNKIRNNLFESFVVIGLCTVIVILCKSTFF